jgi:hypothetical protein
LILKKPPPPIKPIPILNAVEGVKIRGMVDQASALVQRSVVIAGVEKMQTKTIDQGERGIERKTPTTFMPEGQRPIGWCMLTGH